VADAGITALLGDLVFEALDNAIFQRLDLMARTTDQVMMMVMAIA
jgi:hypothetical protein